MSFWTTTFLLLAGAIVPLAYIGTCVWLFRRRVHWMTYIAYFVLFGLVGGACLALALSPSGLAALCIVFLMTVGPIGSLVCSLGLQLIRTRSKAETIAMILGYSYTLLFALLWLAGYVYQSIKY